MLGPIIYLDPLRALFLSPRRQTQGSPLWLAYYTAQRVVARRTVTAGCLHGWLHAAPAGSPPKLAAFIYIGNLREFSTRIHWKHSWTSKVVARRTRTRLHGACWFTSQAGGQHDEDLHVSQKSVRQTRISCDLRLCIFDSSSMGLSMPV